MAGKNKVDILLLGAGGREHAILAKLAQSQRAGRLFVAPGNGGMLKMAQRADVDPNSPDAVADWAEKNGIDLVVIGPEVPLVAGVADAVRAKGIAAFGPNGDAARMEGSKEFAKGVMMRAGVPTAAYRTFTEKEPCVEYVRQLGGPCVVKADGLAAGKGVIVAQTTEEALEGVEECFGGRFGAAGSTVVVEEMLEGPECSLLALTDGKTLVPLATSQDHKRAYDGDKGPNTGGMGAYSPVPIVTDDELASMQKVMKTAAAATAEEFDHDYRGVLYGGFMLTPAGPKVLEYNARFGDPETQVVLARLESDLVDVMMAIAEGRPDDIELAWSDKWAVTVVLASGGYPRAYEKGKVITGVDEANALPDVVVFHAGTAIDAEGRLVTAGGRVLDVTALGDTFEQARERAYQACDLIDFEGKQFRTDIGARAQHPRA